MAKIIKKDRVTKAKEKPELEHIAPSASASLSAGRKVIKAAKPKAQVEAIQIDADLPTLSGDNFDDFRDLDDNNQQTIDLDSDDENQTLDQDAEIQDPEMLRENWEQIASDEIADPASGQAEKSVNDVVIDDAEADWADRGGTTQEKNPEVQRIEGSAIHQVLPHNRETDVYPEQQSKGSSLHRLPILNEETAIGRARDSQGSGLHKISPAGSNIGDPGGSAAYRRMLIDAQQVIKKNEPAKKAEKPPKKITPRWPQARDSSESENKAKAIVDRANQDAEKLRQKVEDEISEAIASEQKRGLADGLQKTQVLQEKVSQLAQGLQREVEGQALEAAVKIARRLLEEELENNTTAIVSVVRQALDSARQQREIFVKVNPVHIEVLRSNKSSIIDALGRARDLDFREDPDLAPGGCMVETEVGTIDARLSTQFDALALQLTGGH